MPDYGSVPEPFDGFALLKIFWQATCIMNNMDLLR